MQKLVHDAVARGTAVIIEETSSYLANRLALETLAREGKVTLQEAAFFKELAKEVLTEAAEELIPDEVDASKGNVSAKNGRGTSLTESEEIVNNLIKKLV